MENDLNKNSDKIERKVWEIPTIEVLNFKQTQGGGPTTAQEDTTYAPPSGG